MKFFLSTRLQPEQYAKKRERASSRSSFQFRPAFTNDRGVLANTLSF
jgi:hypothetical protein